MVEVIKQYFDYYIEGGINTKGEVKSVFDQSALNNAILMWLCSKKGEYIGNPNYGGYLTYHLNKLMSDNRTQQIQISINQGLQKDFFPDLLIQTVEVIPNYVKRTYHIRVKGYCPTINTVFSVDENFRNFSN